ncbi:MAG: LiaF transmembrane domain-containing protein [Bacteroidota bacterium]
MERSSGRGGHAVIGLVLILVGVGLAAQIMDWFPRAIERVIFNWEMILIVLGIIFIASRSNQTTGWILLLIGLVFLVPDLVHIPYPLRRLFWPAMFVIFGVVLLVRGQAFRPAQQGTVSTDPNDTYLNDVSIFGGGEKVITANSFTGGKITAVFGGSNIDLRQANLAQGTQVIDVLCLFGGSNLMVPPEWDVRVEVVSILGGFSDKRQNFGEPQREVGKTLVIRGLAMFGGGELKN